MTLRALLSLTLGDDLRMAPPAGLLSSWEVYAVNNLAAARKALSSKSYSLGLLLLHEPQAVDASELDALLEAFQATQWVGVFPHEISQLSNYRNLILQHFFDFHTWPIDSDRLRYSLGHAYGFSELSRISAIPGPTRRDMALVGESPAIQQLRRQIHKVAQANAPVLIWGESGSGKELTAHAVHNHSSRMKGPFVAVNCGAIPASLIQSELFGYERGAFTGATREKKGLIESATNGTLFLDEIGDLPLEMQANLLRFLQEKTITRIGSANAIEVDVRVIAASHMRLEEAVKSGSFREDLLYRLNVLPLNVPALRERKEDLELLASHFFTLFSHDKNPRLTGFSSRSLIAIKSHNWPGNVRELINRIRRAMVMSEGRLITPQDLDLPMPLPLPLPTGQQNGEALEAARIRAERNAIHVCLQGSGSNVTRAARDLGVSRMTLYRLMEKHGISP